MLAVRPMVQVASAPDDEERESTLRSGDRISGYRIEGLQGVGGMGWVYRARHLIDGHRVAIKVLREDQLGRDRAVDRMMREATILASVPHPGLPRFHECGMLRDGRPWIAMELVHGTPLLERPHRVVAPDAVIAFLGHVAAVLAATHARGITHRDLTPDNILLTPDDPDYPLRVLDWGIAHHDGGARFTSMHEAIGTPTYMAPEQVRGEPHDGGCDVYGLGVLAYQALVGRPPFVGSTAVEILVQHLNKRVPALAPRCPDAPPGLVELVERMLIKRHDERPSAIEVVAAIAELRAAPRLSARELDASTGSARARARERTQPIRWSDGPLDD